LSPTLISPQELRHSLHSIDVRVHSYGAGLRVLRKRPSYYYGLHHFIAARQGNNLVINVHVPLSDLPGNLPVYQVHILPLPVPNANDHATIVTNVPKFFAPFPSHNYYVSFGSSPDIKTSNSLYLEDTKGMIESTDDLACIMAIQQNDKSTVQKACKFHLVTDLVKPDIFIIDRSHVFLTNVNVRIRCPTRPEKLVNCSFTCQVLLPCRCNLTSNIGYIPQRIDDCVLTRDIEIRHNVNLALLQQFFAESELSDILGNT